MAITISASDLPTDIQSCRTAGTCFVNLNSVADVPNISLSSAQNGEVSPFAMNAFTMIRDTGEIEYLLKYNLVVPSGDDFFATPYNGAVWLEVAQQYDLSTNNHLMRLYLDKVTPQPVNLFFGDGDGLDLDIQVDSQGLLNGSLFASSSCCTSPVSAGNMFIEGDFGGGALLSCLADGCASTVTLDLLFLDYSDAGGVASANFNPLDSRSLLLSVSSSFQGTQTQSYYVSTVPVPAAAWLMGSGLLCLAGFARRKISS